MKREVVVITGASAGVGRATAQAFAKRNARIALLARGRDGLEGARREVEQLGGQALVCPTDLANPDQVEAAARAVEEAFGAIDIWINNAMVSVFSPVIEMTPEEFKRVTDVTYLG
ncbi:MAG: SDR family NAD(P)-dependent oxidoreductase [Verrucomicrobiia bacterium]